MKSSHAAFAATALLVLATPGVAATAKTLAATANLPISGSVTVTQGPDRGSKTNADAISAEAKIDRFDPSRGILLGAEIIADLEVSTSVTGSSFGNSPGKVSASYKTSITGAGVTPIVGSTLRVEQSCAVFPCNAAAIGTGSERISQSRKVAANNLKDYVGTGQASLGLQATGGTTAQIQARTAGSLRATGTVTFGSSGTSGAANEIKAIYSYLDFASPSFSSPDPTVQSLALDFGALTVGSAAKTLSFSLSNIGGASTAGLSLKSIAATGSGFTTNLATFTNGLDGGQSRAFSMTLDPVSAGQIRQSLALTFEDWAPEGAVGRRSYTMFLTAEAYVGAPRAPEPGTWAMMVAGFGLVGGAMRGSRRTVRRVAA